MKEVDVVIRRAEGLEDYQKIVQLQKDVWGYTEAEDLAAVPILMIANRFGGAVLVAENPAGRTIGFAMANLGRTEQNKLFWWSHMTAVIPEYRNRDVGFRLKMRQREEALASGIDEIHWTFDPLQALNAHFNIHKLGAIVRHYEENVYGYSSSPLHQGLPTDRFVAEWHLKTARANSLADPNSVQIEIPININELRRTDLTAAKAWQDRVRKMSLDYFARGFAVTDFVLAKKAFYVLEKSNAG